MLLRERERDQLHYTYIDRTVCDSLEQRRRRGERDGTTAAMVAPGAPSVSDRGC